MDHVHKLCNLGEVIMLINIYTVGSYWKSLVKVKYLQYQLEYLFYWCFLLTIIVWNDYEELCKWSKTCVNTYVKSLLFKMSCILSMNSPQICAAENCALSTLNRTEDILPMKVKDNEPFEYRS